MTVPAVNNYPPIPQTPVVRQPAPEQQGPNPGATPQNPGQPGDNLQLTPQQPADPAAAAKTKEDAVAAFRGSLRPSLTEDQKNTAVKTWTPLVERFLGQGKSAAEAGTIAAGFKVAFDAQVSKFFDKIWSKG